MIKMILSLNLNGTKPETYLILQKDRNKKLNCIADSQNVEKLQ